MGHDDGLNASSGGSRQARRISTIGDHDRDASPKAPRRNRVDDRLKIAAAPRDQHPDQAGLVRNRLGGWWRVGVRHVGISIAERRRRESVSPREDPMSRHRSTAATGFYHVVHRSADQTALFEAPRDYLMFLAILRQGLSRYQVPLISFCVLEHHWHVLLGPVGKSRLSRTLQWVTSTHARAWHRTRGTIGDGAVYQARFVSTPLQDLATLVPMSRYVERNAKSAGLVDRAEDWPWSSLHQRVRGPVLVPVTTAAFLGTSSWVDYVNAAITRQERHCGDSAGVRAARDRRMGGRRLAERGRD